MTQTKKQRKSARLASKNNSQKSPSKTTQKSSELDARGPQKNDITDEEIAHDTYASDGDKSSNTQDNDDIETSSIVSKENTENIHMENSNNTETPNIKDKETVPSPETQQTQIPDTSTTSLDSLNNDTSSPITPPSGPSLKDKGKGRATSESRDDGDIQMTDLNTNDNTGKSPHGSTSQPEPILVSDFEEYEQLVTFQLFTVIPHAAIEERNIIRDSLKEYFASSNVFMGIKGPYKFSNLEYFVMQFSDETKMNTYVNKSCTINNAKYHFHPFSTDKLQQEIFNELDNIGLCTIKLVDVPRIMSEDVILKAMNTLGKVTSLIRLDRSLNSYNNNRTQSRDSYRSPFVQYHIIFSSKKPVNKIFTNDGLWSLQIENAVVRILPWDTKLQLYKDRTTFGYKITGLPLNVQCWDILPLMKKIRARTCTIIRKPIGTSIAYMYTEQANFNDKVRGYKMFNSNIYVIPSTANTNFCFACGSVDHLPKDCTFISVDNKGNQRVEPFILSRWNHRQATQANNLTLDKNSNMLTDQDEERRQRLRFLSKWIYNVSSHNQHNMTQQTHTKTTVTKKKTQSSKLKGPNSVISNNGSIATTTKNNNVSSKMINKLETHFNDTIAALKKELNELQDRISNQSNIIKQQDIIILQLTSDNNKIKQDVKTLLSEYNTMDEKIVAATGLQVNRRLEQLKMTPPTRNPSTQPSIYDDFRYDHSKSNLARDSELISHNNKKSKHNSQSSTNQSEFRIPAPVSNFTATSDSVVYGSTMERPLNSGASNISLNPISDIDTISEFSVNPEINKNNHTNDKGGYSLLKPFNFF